MATTKTADPADPGTAQKGDGDDAGRAPARGTSSALASEHGHTSIADVVVAKIAGLATREIDGVHDLGGSTTRAVGQLRQRIPGTRVSMAQGVSVEVGERQAAIDLDIVVDYGVSIADLAAGIRRNVIGSVERMTGLEVTEVDIVVHDVDLGEDDDPESDGRGGQVTRVE